MRRALVLPVFLAGCLGDAAPTASVPDTTADDLLSRTDQAAVADAFDKLHRAGYVADLAMVTADGEGVETGAAQWALRWTGQETHVEGREGTGSLAAGADDALPPFLRDPLENALSDDPPFLDPAARDQYRRAVVGDTVVAGRRLQLVEAVLTDTDRAQAVRRVRAAVDPETRQPVVVEVHRGQEAALYDETSRVRVELASLGDAWVPRRIVTDTRTAVPFGEARHVRAEWTVREVGGQPLAPPPAP